MREPHPDWSPLWVNFKIFDENPYLFYISSPPTRVGNSAWYFFFFLGGGGVNSWSRDFFGFVVSPRDFFLILIFAPI